MSSLQSSPFRSEIGKHFQYSFDFDFLDIVADCLDRIDDGEDVTCAVYDYVDTLNNDSLWTIMRFYQSPASAKLESAIHEFAIDCEMIFDEFKHR